MPILNNPLDIGNLSPQNVLRWSKMLMVEALNATFFNRFAGDGPDMLIQRIMDLSKQAGDTVKYDLLEMEAITEFGVNGNDQLKGSAEGTVTYDQQELLVQQKRHALAHFRMSQQRTLHDLRTDAMRVLRDWFARVMDIHMAAHLVGTVGDNNAGLAADIAAMGNDLHDPTGTPYNLIATAGAFSVNAITAAKYAATTSEPPIRPVRVSGQDYYVMFIHPFSAAALVRSTEWQRAQIDAGLRGDTNRIFTGALGIYDGVIIHAWNYLPTDDAPTADLKYSVLCGAQAGVVGFGRSFSDLDGVSRATNTDAGFPFFWVEELEDYGNELGIAAGSIWGIQKNHFDTTATDFATIRVETVDAAPDAEA